jgi:hypothetical protein
MSSASAQKKKKTSTYFLFKQTKNTQKNHPNKPHNLAPKRYSTLKVGKVDIIVARIRSRSDRFSPPHARWPTVWLLSASAF